MGRKAKLKKQKQKEKYLAQIKNSPIGNLVDYKIIDAMLDHPLIMETFDLISDLAPD